VPAPSAVVLSVAVPFAGVTLPSTFELQFVEPSANAMFPPGVPADDETAAESATFEPAVVVAGVVVVVVVDAGLTVTENAAELDVANCDTAGGVYTATIECVPPPSALVASDPVPPLIVAEPMIAPPSVKFI
jgi:hypothetical protein